MLPSTFEVTKKEIHALRVCPCEACSVERARIAALSVSPPPRHIFMPPIIALALGYISKDRLTTRGSVARTLTELDQ